LLPLSWNKLRFLDSERQPALSTVPTLDTEVQWPAQSWAASTEVDLVQATSLSVPHIACVASYHGRLAWTSGLSLGFPDANPTSSGYSQRGSKCSLPEARLPREETPMSPNWILPYRGHLSPIASPPLGRDSRIETNVLPSFIFGELSICVFHPFPSSWERHLVMAQVCPFLPQVPGWISPGRALG
jgi:hypothetical protein